MKYIGYIEIAIGIGLGLGPTVGSIVYSYLDYEGTMYFFGFINLLGVFFCWALIPDCLNKTISEVDLDRINQKHLELEIKSNQSESLKSKQMTLTMIIKNKESLFALVALLICTYDISFFAAFISLELVDHGLKAQNVGFVLGLHSFVYLFCCLIYPKCCEKWPRKF